MNKFLDYFDYEVPPTADPAQDQDEDEELDPAEMVDIDEACLREVLDIDQEKKTKTDGTSVTASANVSGKQRAFGVEDKDGQKLDGCVDYYTDFKRVEQSKKPEDSDDEIT